MTYLKRVLEEGEPSSILSVGSLIFLQNPVDLVLREATIANDLLDFALEHGASNGVTIGQVIGLFGFHGTRLGVEVGEEEEET